MGMQNETLTTTLALLISGVWAVTALYSLYSQEYTPLTVVTPVMLIVAGFLFGIKVTRNKNGNGE